MKINWGERGAGAGDNSNFINSFRRFAGMPLRPRTRNTSVPFVYGWRPVQRAAVTTSVINKQLVNQLPGRKNLLAEQRLPQN